MLIAMAGLPGTGKSTLAACLRDELGAVVLSKDDVRAVLFPPPVRDYAQAPDDLCMEAIYRAAAYTLTTFPGQAVILDGRTFLRAYQVRDLLALGASVGQAPRVLECVCADAVAQERLEHDRAAGHHSAGNRTYALYQQRKATAEPLVVPRLVLDTGALSLEECVLRALAYVHGNG